MSRSATLLLHSRVPVTSEHKLAVATRLAGRDGTGATAHATFAALEADEVMELTELDGLDSLGTALAERADAERSVASRLTGEWRHEILAHVEDVIEGEGTITSAPMVEMRHIEVPPPIYNEYRDWREGTIYEAVRGRTEIDDFRSYQSILSTSPGVMFIVGFSTAPIFYRTVYDNPKYQEILRDAGDRFIAGGRSGLDCRTYARPDIITSLKEIAA